MFIRNVYKHPRLRNKDEALGVFKKSFLNFLKLNYSYFFPRKHIFAIIINISTTDSKLV